MVLLTFQTKLSYFILLYIFVYFKNNITQGYNLLRLNFSFHYWLYFKSLLQIKNLILFRSPLLKNSWLISLTTTKMFQFIVFFLFLINNTILLYYFWVFSKNTYKLQFTLFIVFVFLTFLHLISRYPLNTFISYFNIKNGLRTLLKIII